MLQTTTAALVGLLLLPGVAVDAAGRDWAKVADSKKEEPTYKSLTVKMTGYNALPEQTDDTPDITASGTRPIPGVTAARSRDLAEDMPFGTVIEVVQTSESSGKSCALGDLDDVGLRVITDLMHPRKTEQVDLFFGNDENIFLGGRNVNPAKALGLCHGIEVRIVGRIDLKNLPNSQRALRVALEKAEKEKALAVSTGK